MKCCSLASSFLGVKLITILNLDDITYTFNKIER